MGVIYVDSADDERLDAYVRLTDRQLRSRLEADSGVLVAESEKVVRVAIRAGLRPLSLLLEERQVESMAALVGEVEAAGSGGLVRGRAGHLAIEEVPEVPVYVLPHEEISRLVGYNVTRGVLCAMRRPAERAAADVLAGLPEARRVAVFVA